MKPLILVAAFVIFAHNELLSQRTQPVINTQGVEKQYQELQSDIQQLAKQQEELGRLMKLYAEKQKQVLDKAASLEKTYDSAIGAAAGGDSQSHLLQATKEMQDTQMSFNRQYLLLQQQMQQENRSYTAVSNIMKSKHDTVKNSISNVR